VTVRINPSILSADFVNLQAEVERVATANALHVDVMDNHFVPNLTFGPQMVRRLHDISPVPLDVHLMIDDVDRWASEYAELGAFSVTFHAEATENPVELARELRKLGARAGLALKPGTSIEPYLESLHEFDQLLVMTVEPGFGGQNFIEAMLPKITAVREVADARADVSLWVQVDGGISPSTIGMAAEAGADTFVAGSSVYNAADPAEAIASLRAAAEAHPYVAS
jgi:ribulose-phosphate 3-epimerase